MLAASPHRSRSASAWPALALCLGGALAGCSSLPMAGYPPFADHAVAAAFVVGADGELVLPATRRDLIVRDLVLEPPPQHELFGHDGERRFAYPHGTHVTARCSLRVYAGADGLVPPLAAVLPGAALGAN